MRGLIRILSTMTIVAASVAAMDAAGATTYAVLNIKSEVVGAGDLAGLTDYLATALSEALPQGHIYSWNDVEKMLENQAKQQTLGCDDEKCLSAIGGKLGVDYLVSGSLAKIGDRSLLNLQLIDIQKARICSRVSQSTTGDMGLLVEQLPDMVKKLTSPQSQGDTIILPRAKNHPVGSPTSQTAPRKVAVSHENMALIPAGTFLMGSPKDEGDPDEHPRHKVTIKSFWIDKTEMTQAAFTAQTKSNPSHWKGNNLPVENVTWQEAESFCESQGKRLPTEAEWEYAARGGSAAKFPWGDVAGRSWEYAWSSVNSGGRTHPVAAKKPNTFGIYDMIGNVSEWCSDEYQKTWYSQADSKKPGGPDKGWGRVCRGGDWSSDRTHLRSAIRDFGIGDYRRDFRGFRCVDDADSSGNDGH